MKNVAKRALCLLFAAVMLLSLVAVPGEHAHATESEQEWPGHVLFEYDHTKFAGGANNHDEADAEAYKGTAKLYEGVNLDKPTIPLYRYEATNPEYSYQFMQLGEIARNDFQLNSGYHTYSIKTTLPADGMKGDGNMVYITDGWTIQIAAMAKDLYTLAGKTVTINISMKITGTLGSANVYVDRMQIVDGCEDHMNADGSQCTACGKVFEKPDPHILYTYDYTKFSGEDNIIDDAEAEGGKARSYKIADLTIYIYDRESGKTDPELQSRLLGRLAATSFKTNEGYQEYEFAFKAPSNLSNDLPYVYFVSSWGVRCDQMSKDIKQQAGKSLVLTISMKVDDSQMYIDQMYIKSTCRDNVNGEGTHCAVCGKEIEGAGDPSAHELFTYDYSYFTGDKIADVDAKGGNAKRFDGLNLTAGAAVKLYRYDPDAADTALQFLSLGALPAANILVDKGYQSYRFETTLPAEGMTDTAKFVYFTDNWSIQNAQMAKDLKTLAGKNVGIVLSMKVTGSVENATVYVDGAKLVDLCKDYASEDGKTCTKCGAELEVAPPEPEAPPTIGNELPFIFTGAHLDLAVAETSGDCVIDDETSATGKAAVISYEVRQSLGANAKELLRTGNQTLKLYIYGTENKDSRLIFSFTPEQLKENAATGGYVEYVLPDFDLIPGSGNYYFYMFDSWGVKLQMSNAQRQAIHDQGYVDIVLSMKVTGDVTNANNPPTYYIDKLEIRPAESGKTLCRHQYGEYTSTAIGHSAACTLCGEVNDEFHKWDNGVISKDYTEEEVGEKLFTCKVCGATRTEIYDGKLRYTFRADQFRLSGDVYHVDADETAPNGMAAVMSYAEVVAAGNSAKHLIRKDNQRVSIYTYGGNSKMSRLIGEFDTYYLRRNIQAGDYVTYKFKNVNVFPEDGTYYMYMFDNWCFQIPFTQEQVNNMKGKRLDVFVTMKITGRVNSPYSSPITYYISEFVFQEASNDRDELTVYVAPRPGSKLLTSLPAIYKADNFRLPLAEHGSGDAIVSDPDSEYGKAVLRTYDKYEAYKAGGGKDLVRTPGQVLRMYTDTAILIGEWTSDDLLANAATGDYVVYEFRNLNLTGSKYMYMFDSWAFQIPMEGLVSSLQGKNVDITVSMKVTGNVTDGSTNPSYYIDCITITETAPVPEHDHIYENWTTDAVNHKATCSICYLRQEGFHMWDAGVTIKEVTTEEDGEVLYTCKICGMEDAKKIKKKPNVGGDDVVIDDPTDEGMNIGLIAGIAGGGLLALIIAIVVVVLVIKKSGKKK